MDFSYSDEQEMLRDTVSKYLAKELPFERRTPLLDDKSALAALWRKFADLGLPAAAIPEDHGGLGGGPIERLIIMEELGRALVASPFLQTAIIAANVLSCAGSATQKNEFLSGIAAGTHIFAFAHAERRSGYRHDDVATTALKDGRGYRLSGRKTIVVGAPLADHFIITARTRGGRRDPRGISAFILPKDAEGVTRRDYRTFDGYWASDLQFENTPLDAAHLLGPENEALAFIECVADEATAAICAEACGAMRMIHSLTLEHARERKQFGHPIASFQVIQHRLVDMLIAIEKAASMTLMCALMLEAAPRTRARAVSAAKIQVNAAARMVGQSAVQTFGGMGMADESSISHYFRRTTMIESQFGASDHHLSRYNRLAERGAQENGC